MCLWRGVFSRENKTLKVYVFLAFHNIYMHKNSTGAKCTFFHRARIKCRQWTQYQIDVFWSFSSADILSRIIQFPPSMNLGGKKRNVVHFITCDHFTLTLNFFQLKCFPLKDLSPFAIVEKKKTKIHFLELHLDTGKQFVIKKKKKLLSSFNQNAGFGI